VTDQTKEQDILESVEFDEEGFLVDPHSWTPELAQEIADVLGLELNETHWKVINFARQDFNETGESPTLRRITTQTGVTTREIYKLFPGGPAKIAAKIAGLNKPTGCI
jgi:TusE/DsrC/DsvC family sulfur relay protein